MRNRSSAMPAGEEYPAAGIIRKAAALMRSFNIASLGRRRVPYFSTPQNDTAGNAAQSQPPAQKKPVTPGTLRLEFSRAADYNKISTFLDPAHKKAIDPQSYVVRRAEPILRGAVNRGGGIFLRNDQDQIVTMTMAYKMHDQGDPAQKADYTEIGTTLSSMARYNSAQLVVAAAALKEWWQTPPKHMLVTEIAPDNKPSLKTYAFYLGWRPISDQNVTADLFKRANATIDPADQSEDAIWLHCDDSVITHQARTLLTFMDQGGLSHKLTRRHIPVDFSALDEVGLTRKRLNALANGETNRARLKRLDR